MAIALIVARRVTHFVVVMATVTWLAFLALALLPGNPAYVLLGPSATPQAVRQIDRKLGLGGPILTRYWYWLDRAFHGNFGKSAITGQPVLQAIVQRLPETLELIILSQIVALGIGVPLGIWAALHAGRRVDRVITTSALAMISVPTFVLGVVVVLVFSVKLHLFPASGYVPLSSSLAQNLRTMVLPSLTLAAGSGLVYTRVMRAGMIDTLRQPFILAARAKGMSRRHLISHHAIRPSVTSLVTMGGIHIGYLIGGAFIIEEIFQLPGVGLLTVQSILGNDYPMVQGVVVLVAAGFITINAIADGLQLIIDPRLGSSRARH